MILDKQEILDNLDDYTQDLGLYHVTEDVLQELDTTYSFNPFAGDSGCFVFKTTEGFLSIPSHRQLNMDNYLVLEDSYIASEQEIQSALRLLKQSYDELLVMINIEL